MKNGMDGLFKNNFNSLFQKEKNLLSDENVKNTFNNLEEKLIEEIKGQININITNTQNDIANIKKKFSENLNLLSTGIDKKANDIIQGFSSKISLFDGLKNNLKESTNLISNTFNNLEEK